MVDFAKLLKEKRAMATRRKIEEPAPVQRDEALQNKYRPRTLGEIRGQQEVVKSLKKAMAMKARPHAFLFTGSAGLGKTTLSRILAHDCGCSAVNIIEVDAASNTGIDAMKGVLEAVRYAGFGDQPNKAYLIDECHMLSKSAWNSLLKTVEEPPPHVFFFFATSEPGKVPETIVSRCNDYLLRPVRYEDIMDLLEDVCVNERFDTPDDILSMVARACSGSPRNALKMLSKVYDIEDRDECALILEEPLDSEEVIDLCRRMMKGNMQWTDVTEGLKRLGEINAETVRIIIVNYLNACLMGAKTELQAGRIADMLHAFTRPTNPVDKMAPILLAFSEFVLRG